MSYCGFITTSTIIISIVVDTPDNDITNLNPRYHWHYHYHRRAA